MSIDMFRQFFFVFQAEDGIRDLTVTGVQTCALPIFEPEDPGEELAAELESIEEVGAELLLDGPVRVRGGTKFAERGRDRKSTRLNSSHSQISYAVFCLKKKKDRNAEALASFTRAVSV